MSYSAAVDGLFALAGELYSAPGGQRRKFDLAAMRALMEALGSPQQRFRSVLIAGTNGKGSTASTLASILRTGGYRVGLYTSPHLTRVNERVRIDGQDISDDDFATYYFRVDDCARKLVAEGRLQWHPSFFETMTALAFLQFAEREVDIAVLEVGMGGRLDATNIVEPLVSVITDISLDHTEWLGGTIAEIAREKAGILRENGVLVTLPQHPEANQTIGEAAVALRVRGVNAAEYVPARGSEGGSSYELTILGERILIAPPLAGSHQHRNIALAIAAAVELSIHHGYILSADQIAQGVCMTRWPGRLERFSRPGQPEVLMDVAHNPAGAWALRSALSHLDPQPGTMTAVFGCLKDKAFSEMAQILFPMFETVVLTEVSSPRSASLGDLRQAAATGARVITAANPQEALAQATEITPPDGIVVVAGSVYLAGELRALLLNPVPEPVS